MTLQISFFEPDAQHPSGSATISEVAQELESEYHLIESFIASEKDKVVRRLIELALDSGLERPKVFKILEEEVKNAWREYMVNEEHGIKTLSSEAHERESFIDTGAYYKNLQVKVTIK